MDAIDYSRRRIRQIARHLKVGFGIQNETCSGGRRDGRVSFARQAIDSHGQFMRQWQSKQTSSVEDEFCDTMPVTAYGSGTVGEKWSSAGKASKFGAQDGSEPIFAKVAPVSEKPPMKVERVEKQMDVLPAVGKKAFAMGSFQEIPDARGTQAQGSASVGDEERGNEGAKKFSPAGVAEHSNSGRLGFEWFPRMDVVESGTAYVITIELPGVSADCIQVEVNRGTLIVTGSRATDWWKGSNNGSNGTVYHRRELAQGPYRTVWRLPKNGDINAITAEVIDGFLRILVPKIKVMAYL